MKIKKLDEDIVYTRKTIDHTFKVGKEGKSVQVREYQTSEVDEVEDAYVNDDDQAKLTDEEWEIFGENLNDFLGMKVNEEVDYD